MESHEYEMDEVRRAIERVNGSYIDYGREPWDLRQNHSSPKPEKLIRMLCICCGGTLSQWDVSHHWAYCYSCRKVLYPESVNGSAEGQRSTNPFHRNRSDTRSWNGNRRNWHRDGRRSWY